MWQGVRACLSVTRETYVQDQNLAEAAQRAPRTFHHGHRGHGPHRDATEDGSGDSTPLAIMADERNRAQFSGELSLAQRAVSV